MEKTRVFSTKAISFLLALITMLTAFSLSAQPAQAASKTPAGVYADVKKAYGSSFPLTSKDRISGKKRVLGVNTSYLSSYYAASKVTGGSSSKVEYTIFICKAKNANMANKTLSALKSYLKNEQQSMSNYLSSNGKKVFANAKTGKKGKYVYLVMLDTASNKKAVNAINKSLK